MTGERYRQRLERFSFFFSEKAACNLQTAVKLWEYPMLRVKQGYIRG